MATRYFVGGVTKVAQVVDVTIGGTITAADVFDILVDGVSYATYTASGGDTPAIVVAALVTAWNLSTHPYTTGITASDSDPAVTLTSDLVGVPFTVTATVSGTATAVPSTTTANAGPNVLDLTGNWNGNTLPAVTDDLVFDKPISVCWGLEGLTFEYGTITLTAAYASRWGLDSRRFATSADSSSYNDTVHEYRPAKVKIKCDTFLIGLEHGPIPASAILGPSRVNVDLQDVACQVDVVRTASTSADPNRPVVRIIALEAATNISIRSGAVGGVGIATDVPGETATIGKVYNAGSTAQVTVGGAVTLSKYDQFGGTGFLNSAPSTDTKVKGGLLHIDGEIAHSAALTIRNATVFANNVPAAGNALGTVTVEKGGTLDGTKSGRIRTWNSVTIKSGGNLLRDEDSVTINTFVPEGGAASG